MQDPEVLDIKGLTGTVAPVVARDAGAPFKTIVVTVTGQPAADPDLVANPDIADSGAQALVLGQEVIVRDLVFPEAFPGNGVTGTVIAGELAVPETEPVQVDTIGIVTPDNADIGNIEMIVPEPMQAVVAVMVP